MLVILLTFEIKTTRGMGDLLNRVFITGIMPEHVQHDEGDVWP